MNESYVKTIDEVAATPAPWKYGSLALVDTVGTKTQNANFLVRGPLPVSGDNRTGYTFDYDGLCAAIEARVNVDNGQVLKKPYFLHDVSLLHPDESGQLRAEQRFFEANPALGQFMHWDTYGTDRCMFDVLDPAQRDRLAQSLDSWLNDQLADRIEQVRALLTAQPPPGNTSTVVYIHCDGGCDRTGEMIGAYILRFLGMSWQEMYASNQACARPFGCGNYRAVQWYARYLELTQGYVIPGIGEDGGCFDGVMPMQERDPDGNLDMFSTPILFGCRPRAS